MPDFTAEELQTIEKFLLLKISSDDIYDKAIDAGDNGDFSKEYDLKENSRSLDDEADALKALWPETISKLGVVQRKIRSRCNYQKLLDEVRTIEPKIRVKKYTPVQRKTTFDSIFSDL